MPPTVDQVTRFAAGGFLDVASLGWPAEFQMVVWLSLAMVAVSTLNVLRIVPVFPVTPRTANGAAGIFLAPFMHGSPMHLASNVLGLLIIGFVLAWLNPGFWPVVAAIALISGAIYWAIGPAKGSAVGASDALFGAWAYWMAHQWSPLDTQKIAFLAVLFAVFGYFMWKAFAPTDGGRLSHLVGASVGLGAAYVGF